MLFGCCCENTECAFDLVESSIRSLKAQLSWIDIQSEVLKVKSKSVSMSQMTDKNTLKPDNSSQACILCSIYSLTSSGFAENDVTLAVWQIPLTPLTATSNAASSFMSLTSTASNLPSPYFLSQ